MTIHILRGVLNTREDGVKILNVYSKPLADKVREAGNKIFMFNFKDGFLIKPNGDKHITIPSGKRLQIAVTKLVKTDLNIQKSEVPIYVNPEEWNIKYLLKSPQGSPEIKLPIIEEKNLVIKKAALSKNVASKNKFNLHFSSKAIFNIAKNNEVRFLINRKDNIFTLIRSDEPQSRKLVAHSGNRLQLSIPKPMLNENDFYKLSKNNWYKVFVRLDLKSFKLNVDDFFFIREEKELVKSLTKRGFEVNIKDVEFPFDILLKNKIAIEIHNSKATKYDLSSKHGLRAAQVRVRIFEGLYNKRKLNLDKVFIILNDEWKKSKHVEQLRREAETKGIHVLFTSFKNNWSYLITKEIDTFLV